MPSPARALGVVAVTAVVVVALSVVPTLLVGGAPSFQPGTVDHPEYAPETLLQERPDQTGRLNPQADADGARVVIDYAHENRFSRAEIQPLVRALSKAGFTVDFHENDEDLETSLEGADSFIVMDPGDEYEEDAVETIQSFTDRGGQLVLIGDPTKAALISTGFGTALEPRPNQLGPLSRLYGLNYRSNYLFNLDEYAGLYRNLYVTPATENSPLTAGVDRLVFYTAAELDAVGGTTIFETGPETQIRGTDTTRARSVVVRKGNVIAIGDATLFTTSRYTTADNDVFIENLVEYLASR